MKNENNKYVINFQNSPILFAAVFFDSVLAIPTLMLVKKLIGLFS
jgi:hypothetical protein